MFLNPDIQLLSWSIGTVGFAAAYAVAMAYAHRSEYDEETQQLKKVPLNDTKLNQKAKREFLIILCFAIFFRVVSNLQNRWLIPTSIVASLVVIGGGIVFLRLVKRRAVRFHTNSTKITDN